MIISRTPFRISFFGGGTDYPKWFTDNGGAVLSTSIDKYCYISLRKLPPFFEHKHRIVYSKVESVKSEDKIAHPVVRAVLSHIEVNDGLEIHHDGDLPARSGLGSSSSFTVGLLNAIYAYKGSFISSRKLAEEAIHIEQNIIGENVGSQDQVAAAIGGLNKISFNQDGSFSVSPIIISRSVTDNFQKHLLLFFTGVSRFSSDIAEAQLKNMSKKEKELLRMHDMVDMAISILNSNDMDSFGELMKESWDLKSSLSSMIASQKIKEIYETAISAGATSGKILGAGGGGFIMFFAKPQYHMQIKRKLNNLVNVPFNFEREGSQIVLYEPNGL